MFLLPGHLRRLAHLSCLFLTVTLDDLDRREVAPNRVRRDLRHLSDRDIMSLKAAMHDLQQDTGTDGYQVSASVILCGVLLLYVLVV